MIAAIDENIIPDIYYVVFRKCTDSWQILEQQFDVSDFTYIIQGGGRYTIDGKDYDLNAGDLLYLSGGCTRAAVTFPDRLMHCFSVDFRLRDAKNHDAAMPFPLVSHIGHKEDVIHLLHELSFAWLNKQPGYMIKSRGLFLQILHRFMELILYQVESPTGDSRIVKAMKYMMLHYSEHISVKMMAEMTGLNPTYFGVLFKQESGMSFNRYLIHVRVKNAENMLISGENKVSDVAEACGFTDVSHFYKQFKEIKGFAPSHCLPKKF